MVGETKQHLPVFVASTKKDLQEFRDAVFTVLEKLQHGVKGMEFFGARSDAPLATCLKEVGKSKIFIAIIGMRYGSIMLINFRNIMQN